MAAPPPVALPAPPLDPNVQLPLAPVSPPTVGDVLAAIRYRRDVDLSARERPPAIRCTPNDCHNAILYEHSVVTQAAAAAGPQAVAPLWFQAAVQQLRIDIRNDIRAEMGADLKRLINQGRGNGTVVPYEIVPFANGTDPTQPPHNLPPLHSVNVIDNLAGNLLVAYLNGYNVVPLPAGANPQATNRLRKAILKQRVGGSM